MTSKHLRLTVSDMTRRNIPSTFPVRPLSQDEDPKGKCTCGNCGLSWDDDAGTPWTPVPGGRCPFEYFHPY